MRVFQIALLAAILWLTTAISSAYAYDPADFLPLAVGNSWAYEHIYYYRVTRAPIEGYERLTITITHTEEIDGHTYYVFDTPEHQGPLPYFFLAGKKVRFAEDGRLMEWEDGQKICLYDFSPDLSENPYSIPEHDGDTQVRCDVGSISIRFHFIGRTDSTLFGAKILEARYSSFYKGLGMQSCVRDMRLWLTDFPDVPDELNDLNLLYAFINGKRIELKDLFNSIAPCTWGQIKRLFTE